MSEYQIQRKEKPSIYELIDKNLSDKLKEDLFGFLSFLKENRMTPQWGSTNTYNLSYKNRRVCIIKLAEDSYQIWLNTQYNEDFNECFSDESDENKEYLLGKMVYCFGCGSCKPGLNIELLGVEQKKACYNPVIRMENPNEELLKLARKLVMLRRKAIAEGKAPKITYVSVKKR